MKKDLALTSEDIGKELINPKGRFHPILTKAADSKALGFRTIDEKALQTITDFMPEVNRSVAAFNKQNSQTTSSLMSLNMVDSGPYRVLRQILAQIENKRGALKENIYKLEESKIDFKELEHRLINESLDDFEYERLNIKKEKIAADIIDATGHIEAAIKELGAYTERYKEVCKNKNIPEKWDEQDFEEAEIEHHIKSMFRNAIRDRMQGTHNQGTLEYFHQYGLNGVVAYALVDSYLGETVRLIRESEKTGKLPTIDMEYDFLDKMYNLFKDEYRRALNRLGLDSVTYADWLMKEHA